VENPETDYAVTPDGIYLAYQTLGTGPPDLVWQPDWPGNIDFEWDEFEGVSILRDWAGFSRVIVHDQRGIGLSSRNVPLADLETRAADLRLVLDAAGAERVVLCGIFNSGGVNALFAATYPERVQSLVWVEPSARVLPAQDYPWGVDEGYRAAAPATLELWGTSRYGRAHVEHERSFGNLIPDDWADQASKQARNACTPDVAKQMAEIWYDIDVRAVLPAVRCPALLLSRSEWNHDEARFIASLMPNAEMRLLPPGEWGVEHLNAETEEIRRCAARRRTARPNHRPATGRLFRGPPPPSPADAARRQRAGTRSDTHSRRGHGRTRRAPGFGRTPRPRHRPSSLADLPCRRRPHARAADRWPRITRRRNPPLPRLPPYRALSGLRCEQFGPRFPREARNVDGWIDRPDQAVLLQVNGIV
jgi:pimeloyl-ACP methyl ester carboxylesterase